MWTIIAPLIRTLATGSVKQAVGRTRSRAIYWVLIAIALLSAFVFLCVGAYLMLSNIYTPLYATMILSAFWLVISLLIYLISYIHLKKKDQTESEEAAAEHNRVLITTAMAALPLAWQKRSWGLLGTGLAVTTYLLWKKNQDDK